MGTTEELLRLLEDNRERYISGQKLAETIGVSRNSIWKAISTLRSQGYDIAAVTNKGYALSQKNDLLSVQGIEHFLAPNHPFTLVVRKLVDSTNAEARRRALEGAAQANVIVAEEQSAGKGQRGKQFFSPPQTGIYLSIILRPALPADRGYLLTCAAALACAQAIEEVTGVSASIKWVNDVFCQGKKVAGILTEGALNVESGYFDYVVVGMGINVKPPVQGFPQSIAHSAGSVCPAHAGALRNHLVAAILSRFWELYEAMPTCSFFDEYRRRCFIIGNYVVLNGTHSRTRVRTIGLTNDFKLIVEFPDKTRQVLSSAEASSLDKLYPKEVNTAP